MILTSPQWSLVHILLCKPGILQPTLEGRGSSHCAFQGFGRLGGCHLRDSESGAVDSLRAGGCFSTVPKRLWSNGGLWWFGDAAHLLCFLFSPPRCFLVIKRKCVFHFVPFFFICLPTKYVMFLFVFVILVLLFFLFFLSYHCSTATMVRSPLYMPMDQNPGALLFTPDTSDSWMPIPQSYGIS